MRYRLDSTAIVHCALMNKEWINAYRITVTMKEPVDPVLLQQAADSMPERFPTICSRIVSDAFWYYTEKLDRITVRQLDCGLLGSVNNKNIFDHAINLMYEGDRIILEAFHSVTDGHGAFTFLNSLIDAYVKLKMGSFRSDRPSELFTAEEREDAFIRYGDTAPLKNSAVQVDSPFFFEKETSSKSVNATVFRMKTSQIKQRAKDISCTMNELLVAAIFKAVFRMPATEGRDVALTVPINLRRHFSSRSLLNFTYLSTAALPHTRKDMTIKDMAESIRRQLKKQNNPDYLRRAVSQIASVCTMPVVKLAPLFLKNLFIRAAIMFGYEKTCMTVTNLGNVAAMLPAGENHIKNIDVLLSPRRNAPYNCGIVSYNEELHIILTHGRGDSPLVKAIGARLEDMGIVFHCTPYV